MRSDIYTNLKGARTMSQGSKPNLQYFPADRADAPYSTAVRVGNMLFLSGMLGTDSSGQLAKGGIGPETRQTMENIRAALERYGSSFDQVVKVTVMLADIGEWQAMNDVYVTYFST